MRRRYQSLLVHMLIIALYHVAWKGGTAEETESFEWGERTREVEQGPEGALYVLEDGDGGRLLKLTPSRYKALRRNKGSTFDCKMLPTRPPTCSLVF